MIRRFRIIGASMAPTLESGRRVWAVLWPYRWLRPGMLVLAEHPVYGLLAKRLAAHEPARFLLSSDNHNVDALGCNAPLTASCYVGRIIVPGVAPSPSPSSQSID